MAGRGMRFIPHNISDRNQWSVGLYVRLSDEDRGKVSKTDLSQSIENQIAYLKSCINMLNEDENEKYKLSLYGIYSDDDYTGMNFKRPEFMRMMQDVESDKIDCIIVKNLSRLGRYDNEMQRYMESVFERRGKEVRFIAVGDNYDSLYDEMDILVKFKLLMNREYSETQHRNVTVAMRSMQEKGLYVGAFAPYGYKKCADNKHKLEPDIVAAEVVKRIFRAYLSGHTSKEIARGLTDDDILCPSAYKRLNGSNFRTGRKISEEEVHWTRDTVKRILMSEVYIGTLVQHKKVKRKLTDEKAELVPKDQWIRCENAHEAIISKEDWEFAQSMMKTIKRDPTSPNDMVIFKGLLKCGDCHHAMRKRWDSYTCVKTGKKSKYLYYNCATFRDYGVKGERKGKNFPTCTSHYISDKVIRKIVINDINTMISQVNNLADMASKIQSPQQTKKSTIDTEIKAKESRVSVLNNRLKMARNKWLDGYMEDSEYQEIREEIERDVTHIENQIHMLKSSLDSASTVLENSWVKKLLEMGKITELDRTTVITLINTIYVYEDKRIEIVYKFSDEFDSLFAAKI